MIAKPTKYTLPLAILLVLILTFLGWLFNAGNGSASSKEDPSAGSESNSSLARPSRQSAKKQRTPSLKPANIDVRKRLDALYAQYPELAIPVKDPEKSLLKIYEDLFPEDDNTALYAELKIFEELLKKKSPWSDDEKQSAIDFLAKEQDRLNTMMNLTDSSYHFQNSNGVAGFQTFLFPAFQLMNTNFGLHAKLGNIAEAGQVYHASNQIMQLAQNENLTNYTITLISSQQLNETLMTYSDELPLQIYQLILENSNHPVDYREIINSEFSDLMEMFYQVSSLNDQGDFVIEGTPDLPIRELESFVIASFLERIDQIQKIEQLPEDLETMINILNSSTTAEVNSDYPEVQSFTAPTLGLYYDTMLKIKFITQTQQTAVKIALAQSRGETFTGELPKHYKTGEPIVWDRESNVLHTGVEVTEYQDLSTIKIPKIKGSEK